MSREKFLLGIKQQILMVTLIPGTLLVLVLAVYLVGTRFDDLDHSFKESGEAITKHLATAVIPGLLTQNYSNLTLLAEQSIERYPTVRSIQIIDKNNQPIIIVGGIRAKEIKNIARFEMPINLNSSAFDLYPYKLQRPIGPNPDTPSQIGVVRVHISGLAHEASKIQLMGNTALLSIVGLLLSAALSIFLSARIADPIEKLTIAMQRMRKGALDVRVTEQARGEIGELQRGFNTMTQEIENANENMLMQVDQATHDLQASMEVLEIKNVELDLARKRALSASRFKSEFLASMSHEIRTPMNGILGFTDLLAKTSLNDSQEEYIKTIRASSANLLTIIDDILDLSKLEVGKLTLDPRPFSLRECIENAISLLAPMAHEKQLELVSIVYNDMPDRLIGDKTRIAQIVTNLVNNAIKFTSNGEIVLRAMLEEEGVSSVQMTLSVSDTGSGISTEEQQLIFSAFEQGANASILGSKGTGLGLSISKRLATAMGGDITLTSTFGEGSCFSVSLHLNKDLSEYDSLLVAKGRGFSGQHVLLMDEHHASRMVLRNDLHDLGLQVDDIGSYQLPDSTTFQDYEIIFIALDAKLANSPTVLHKISDILRVAGERSVLLASISAQDKLDELATTGVRMVKTKPIKLNLLRETIANLIPPIASAKPLSSAPQIIREQSEDNWMSGSRVLVADDNKINRQLIETILQGYGATVFTVENGQEAVNIAFSANIDLVLMDIHMPIMDGFAATRQIRERFGITIPVIALTADAMEKNREEIKRAGFDGYLIKPLDDKKLKKMLGKIVRASSGKEISQTLSTNATTAVIQVSDQHLARDHEKAMSIAGGSETIAKKLFDELLSTLHGDFNEIEQSLSNNDWNTLWQQLHKMQGSTAVCAVPALHHAIQNVQFAVKQEDPEMAAVRLVIMKLEIARLHNSLS